MSQAEMLLKSLYVEPASDVDDGVLVIDNYTRMIKIPDSIKNLGVTSDDEVHKVQFRMPAIYCGIDLSKFKVRINYLNAKNEGDVYEVTDVKKVGDNLTFSWLVGRHATLYKGLVKFIVCMKDTDTSGNVLREFNTTVTTLPVLEGLETGEQAVADYTDLMEQWREMLFGIGDTEEANIKTASETEQEAIEQKGIEVLATIPEDYTTTYEMANNACRTRANAIVSTVEGETISVSDTSDDPLRGLRIFGKTTQVTTTGVNLAYVNINVADYPYLGVTCSATADGNVRLTGISTSNMWNRLASASLVAGKTYTLSSNKLIGLSIWDVTADAAFGVKSSGKTSVTFVAPNTGNYSLCIENVAGVTFPSILADIMLNEGDTALPWEPYSNGIASPSTSWPQNLTNIIEPNLIIAGKNLFPVTTMTAVGVTLSAYNGYFVLNGTAETSYNFGTRIGYLPSGKYTLCANNPVHNSVNYAICDIYSDETKQVLAAFDNKINSKISGIYNEASDWIARIRIEKGVTYNNYIVKPQLEVGFVASEYTPFVPAQVISVPYSLPGIPVSEGGNYTDANGQQWICDEIDLERGAYIRRIGETLFDDKQVYHINAYRLSDSGHYVFGCSHSGLAVSDAPVMSDQYRHVRWDRWGLDTATHDIICYTGVAFFFFLVNQEIQTIEAFTEYMGEHPATVQYILATPIETPLTAEEIEIFKALHSNYPNTTILNNVGATMEIKYNADTKIWIANVVKSYAGTGNSSGSNLIDDVTGKAYSLKVSNGKLMMEEV